MKNKFKMALLILFLIVANFCLSSVWFYELYSFILTKRNFGIADYNAKKYQSTDYHIVCI